MWKHITIAEKTLDVWMPPAARWALLWLHSRDEESIIGNKHFESVFASFAVDVPRARHTWFSSRVYPPFAEAKTAEAYLLNDVLPAMREWKLPIAVAGVGMGGQAALRLGFKDPERFPVVYGLCSAIDFHERFDEFPELPVMYRSREQARQDTATLWAGGKGPRHVGFGCDPRDAAWFPGNDRLHEKLRAIGIEHTSDLSSTHDNYLNAMAEPMMQFLKNGLEREKRRLL